MDRQKNNMRKKLLLYGFHWDKKYLKINSPENGRITFLSLEMKAICNAKCLYCLWGPELNKEVRDTLTLKEMKNIIKEGKELGVKTVVFPGRGEPTLDLNLRPLVEFISKLGLTSVIYTYGVLNDDIIKFLYNHNANLIIKIDSLNKNHYEKLVGLPFENFKESLNSIANVYKNSGLKGNNYLITRLAANTLVTEINKNDLSDITHFCKENNIKHFIASVVKVGWAEDNWKELTGNNVAKLHKVNSSSENWISSATVDGNCGLFAHGVSIDTDGNLIGCPTARWIRLGNIRRNSLQDLIKIYRDRIHSLEQHYCLARELTFSKEA
ncbi:MAG: radical SAM protein [Candidatus Marinimicrobia bacterium]|nr:radical SAM protein [Candidatus Neomarinimicrobiota bacterium]